MKRLAIVLSALTLSLVIQAAEPVECLEAAAPRPLFTTGAAVADPGVLELELGGQKIYNQDGTSDRNIPAQLNMGICEWFDVRLGWGGPTLRKDAQGLLQELNPDPVFGSQIQCLKQDKAGVDMGIAWWHKVPVGNVAKGASTGKHDDTLLLTLSKNIGRWAFDLNAGANFIGRPEGSGRVRQEAVSLAITYAVAPKWNITLDTYHLSKTELGEAAFSSILAVSREITPDLTVDVGFEFGHTDGAPKRSLNVGLVWRFGKLW